MILKGSSRAGALDLGLHLSNELDNEAVHIHSISGSASDNLYGAFREWEAICSQTKATKPFYSLSINPDPSQRDWTDKEWESAIDRIETKLGLTGQPRAVIFHEKVGASDGNLRKHGHVVWSRIDAVSLKAAHMGNDRYKLKACVKDLAQEFGLELRYDDRCKSSAYDLGLSHGQNRDPETAKERKSKITRLWKEDETAASFESAMRQHGYVIAQGDRRAFVIVDRDGEVHSLARQIDGIKSKDIKERLGDSTNFPDVETAKDEQTITRRMEQDAPTKQSSKPIRVDLSVEQKLFSKLRRMAQRQDKLAKSRRLKLEKDKRETAKRHAEEKQLFICKHRQRDSKRLLKRYRSRPTGLFKSLRAIFGYELAKRWQEARSDQRFHSLHQKRCDRLMEMQAFELERLGKRSEIIMKQEKREAQSIAELSRKLENSHHVKRQPQLEQRAKHLRVHTKFLK